MTFKIRKEDCKVDKKGPEESEKDEKVRFENFRAALTKSGRNRYGIIDWKNKLIFVSWNPTTAKRKDRMIYATTRESIRTSCSGVHESIQADDDSDLSIEAFDKAVAKYAV